MRAIKFKNNDYLDSTGIVDNKIRLDKKINGIIGWENSDISEPFKAKNITLSTNDYNYYEIIWKTATTDNIVQIAKGIKGYGTNMSYMNTPIEAESMYRLGTRQLNYIDDTHYSFSDGYYRYVINNEACIPIKIMLYK